MSTHDDLVSRIDGFHTLDSPGHVNVPKAITLLGESAAAIRSLVARAVTAEQELDEARSDAADEHNLRTIAERERDALREDAELDAEGHRRVCTPLLARAETAETDLASACSEIARWGERATTAETALAAVERDNDEWFGKYAEALGKIETAETALAAYQDVTRLLRDAPPSHRFAILPDLFALLDVPDQPDPTDPTDDEGDR